MTKGCRGEEGLKDLVYSGGIWLAEKLIAEGSLKKLETYKNHCAKNA